MLILEIFFILEIYSINIAWFQGQHAQIVDSQERAQRALIGTIEASIKAVEKAEEEIEKPVEIEIPRLTTDPASRRWVETKVEVEKQKVFYQHNFKFLISIVEIYFLK